MSVEGERLFRRLKALCCKNWGLAPPVFDLMISRGEILLGDVVELVRLCAHDPVAGLGLDRYLNRERWEREGAEAEEFNRLSSEYGALRGMPAGDEEMMRARRERMDWIVGRCAEIQEGRKK